MTRSYAPAAPASRLPAASPVLQMRRPPVAPPAYRPQPMPTVLQANARPITQPALPAGLIRAAPPAYRPQLTRRALQPKIASGQQALAGQLSRQASAPRVYRPEPRKVLQPKMRPQAQTGNRPQQFIRSSRSNTTVPPSRSFGVIQRITLNGAAVNIGTLNLADSKTHLGRLRRLRGQLAADPPVAPGPADVGYVYALADEAALVAHIAPLEAQALEVRRLAAVANLEQQLAALATVNDHTVQPPWNGLNPGAGIVDEALGTNVALGQVVPRWQAFLQVGAYSHKHPRTGVVDDTRLVSADGQRSIRYGDHEKTSPANLHHFHEETWTHNGGPNTLAIANRVRRVPVL